MQISRIKFINMKQSHKVALIITLVVAAILVNHLFTRGTCQLRDDVTMKCISSGITSKTLLRLLVIDVIITITGIFGFLKVANTRLRKIFFRLSGILAIVILVMFTNHILAPSTCLEYSDVSINGDLDCFQQGLTNEAENRLLIIDGIIIILGLLGAGKVLLSSRDKSSNAIH